MIMENKELIKRLLSFDDEVTDTSTGYVSATGMDNEATDEVMTALINDSIRHTRRDWFYADNDKNLIRFRFRYTEKNNLYIHYTEDPDNPLVRMNLDFGRLINVLRGKFDDIRHIVFVMRNLKTSPMVLNLKNVNNYNGPGFNARVCVEYMKDKIRFDIAKVTDMPEHIYCNHIVCDRVPDKLGEVVSAENADDTYDLLWRKG